MQKEKEKEVVKNEQTEKTENKEKEKETKVKHNADQLVEELYKKKMKNFSKKWATRESKVNLKKETSSNNYDFQNFGKRMGDFMIDKKETQKNKAVIKGLDDEYSHFFKMVEVMDKTQGLVALERIEIIDRMLKEVPQKSIFKNCFFDNIRCQGKKK